MENKCFGTDTAQQIDVIIDSFAEVGCATELCMRMNLYTNRSIFMQFIITRRPLNQRVNNCIAVVSVCNDN